MAYIESHQEIEEHPKTKRLARSLGELLPPMPVEVLRSVAIGYLHRLWWWAISYAPEGDITKYGAAGIADGVGWPGDPDSFLAALMDSGWVDRDGELHDWGDYAGKLIERRRKEAARKREQRQGEDIRETSDGHPQDVAGNKPNLTNQTKADQSVTVSPPSPQTVDNPGTRPEGEDEVTFSQYRSRLGLLLEGLTGQPTSRGELEVLAGEWWSAGITMDALLHAEHLAKQRGDDPSRYFMGIVQRFMEQKVHTVEDAVEATRQHKDRAGPARTRSGTRGRGGGIRSA
jgi:hypothetical protein